MSTIDIRNNIGEVTNIVVADPNVDIYVADTLVVNSVTGGFNIKDTHASRTLRVRDRQHAENLIKGLQKAIELGWV